MAGDSVVSDGRCPLCARAVPGLPGEEAPCTRCGVYVRIPLTDQAPVHRRAPVVPPPTSLPKAPAPEPPRPVVAAKRRAAWPWLAVLVVLVLVGAGLGTQAFLAMPPTPRSLEKRLATWDAAGDGSAYRLLGYEERADGGTNTFERIVHLSGDEYLLRNAGKIIHHRDAEYYITFANDYDGPYREPTVGRDEGVGPPFATMPVRVLNRTERLYMGILGSQPFTLELDAQERFRSLFYQNHRGDRVHLHYEYEAVAFPSFIRTAPAQGAADYVGRNAEETVVTSLPRNAANFVQPERGVEAARVVIEWNQDSRRASDFLVRFKDASGELMAETPMSSVALPGGFHFAWDDRNGDGLVDEGDAYSYGHPADLQMEFYDVWARQAVGSPRREGPWDPQWDLVTPSWRLYSLRQSS